MIDQEQIKEILFSKIEDIGRNTIQTSIASDIQASKKYMDTLIEKVLIHIKQELGKDIDNKSLAVICESILHFMLTFSTIPSERKIEIERNLTVDIIIPNQHMLKVNSNKSLAIQIIKEEQDLMIPKRLKQFWPDLNIWIVSANSNSKLTHRTYSILSEEGQNKFSSIIIDIDNFLKSKGDKSFRFFIDY